MAAVKSAHICPPSQAIHPSDRWESLFIYGFICKFTKLRSKVQGLESSLDFEVALMSRDPDPILVQIVTQFILNLRPQTRNIASDQISSTLAAVFAEYLKSSERTLFWDDDLNKNKDPFEDMPDGFFAADWDLKLKILRVLVELQLCHSPEIKSLIDRSWGVVHNKHKKKDDEQSAHADNHNNPTGRDDLMLQPIGQDSSRKRYWVIDNSPRIYESTNPWKIASEFRTVSSTREEYLTVVHELKKAAPAGSSKKNKAESSHVALIKALEDRIEAIDNEAARVARVRKKIEQKQLLMAQALVRETRTRRQTRRPDYVYNDGHGIDDDDTDDYTYQDDVDIDEFTNDAGGRRSTRGSRLQPTRRSARTRNSIPDEKTNDQNNAVWKGERRSARLGAPPETQFDAPSARPYDEEEKEVEINGTDDPTPTISGDMYTNGDGQNKSPGAAAVKPHEFAVEQVAGKKKSKYWYYAVEPVPGAIASSAATDNSSVSNGDSQYPPESSAGASNGEPSDYGSSSEQGDAAMDVDDSRDLDADSAPLDGAQP